MAKEKKREVKMDRQAMMEVYQKLGTPGAPHKILEGLAGRWNAKVRSWMEPDQPPMESKGSCEQKMILGGRFLWQEFKGDMMGTPFTGIEVTGYDNHTKKYISTWMDSMSTSIMFFEGDASADRKTIIQESRYDDPVRGPMKWRAVTKIADKNTFVFEMYNAGMKGEEVKSMEITYTRKK